MLRSAAGLVLMLTAGLSLHAEGDCGQLLRAATFFRGTIRGIEILGDREVVVTPADRDPRYIVTIDIKTVRGEHLDAGTTRHFAIHSPALTFGSSAKVGKTLDLQVVWRG